MGKYEPIDTWEKSKNFSKEINVNDLIVEELEKTKEELLEYSRYTAGNDLVVDWENIEEVFKDRIAELKRENTRDCKTCKHSKDGECAFTETCHCCMWNSKWELKGETE